MYYAFAVVGVLAALLFGFRAIDIAGTTICDEALRGEECLDKSSTIKTITVIAASLTALAAVATALSAIRFARGTASYSALRAAAIATVVFAAVTILL